jgi:nucleolar GTP-binding protein
VQIALFHSIKPLFAGKQLVVVASKQDIKKLSELSAADQAAVQSMIDGDTLLLPISNLTEEGIDTVKNIACDKLLEARVSSSASTPPSTQSDHICTLSLVLPVSPKQPVANDCARLSAALALTGGPKQWRPFVRATHNGTK